MTGAFDVPAPREFVVVACEEDRRGELRHVQATTHEEAVTMIVAAELLSEAEAVYEVWPAREPGCVLRVTLGPPGLGRASA